MGEAKRKTYTAAFKAKVGFEAPERLYSVIGRLKAELDWLNNPQRLTDHCY